MLDAISSWFLNSVITLFRPTNPVVSEATQRPILMLAFDEEGDFHDDDSLLPREEVYYTMPEIRVDEEGILYIKVSGKWRRQGKLLWMSFDVDGEH